MFEAVLFLDFQRIHVGAQTERSLAVAFFQQADDAGVADRGMHFEPELCEQVSHFLRSDALRRPVPGGGEYRAARPACWHGWTR
jgi:hypothetical protein